jgi:hypothetical protein
MTKPSMPPISIVEIAKGRFAAEVRNADGNGGTLRIFDLPSRAAVQQRIDAGKFRQALEEHRDRVAHERSRVGQTADPDSKPARRRLDRPGRRRRS